MVTSAGSCRTGRSRLWEQWNWCVGGLLRMCGESLLLPVWSSVGGGFIGEGELDAWVVSAMA